MTSTCKPPEAANRLLDGYVPERDMAKARDVELRTLRNERQRGDGPPFVKINKRVWYPESGFRDWLLSLERHPVRAQKRAS
jgi:hypothetical protein